ncbi:MAG: arylsulfotransferase family protein [Solirubrobacteraceae bacterium]
MTFHSAPTLDAERVCMNLGVATHSTQPGTYLFLTPGGTYGTGVGIFKDNGTLVWWHHTGDPKVHDASVVTYLGRPYLAVFSGHPAAAGPYDNGTVTLYNQHYQKAGRITSGRPFGPGHVDLHEFRITPQGRALIGITNPVRRVINGHPVTVIEYVVQELSLVRDAHGIHTGRVLFQWKSLPQVPVSETYAPDPGAGRIWDYFHGNSIAQDTDGNLIISARGTWGIYKVSIKTGRIMWQVGGRGDHTLRHPWCFQHDAVPLGGNEYTVFDDSSVGSPCQSGGRTHPARGIIVRVDPSRHPATVRLVRAYIHRPSIHPVVAGSMQLLADGDALIDWGYQPEVTEFGANGQVNMDLSLSRWSYRGLRFAWDGQPLTPPAISAQFTSTTTRLWASWNGSTEVAAWRVLAGPNGSALKPVGNAVPKRSFETSILLQRRYATVEVQALDAHGRVLATSRPASAASDQP